MVRISDNGPGIPRGQRDAIFRPGVRLAGAHDQGTGMGLAIVKRIVDRAGGHIALVDGALGTTFELRLPGIAAPATTPRRAS